MTDTTDVSDSRELSYDENPIPSVFHQFVDLPRKIWHTFKICIRADSDSYNGRRIIEMRNCIQSCRTTGAVLEAGYAEIGLQNS